MKKREVEEKIKFYESRIVNDFDEYFEKLVLEDFYMGGCEDIMKDEYLYNEYFEDYKDEIVELLLDIEFNKTPEYLKFKQRLIKLKRIIDNKITETESDEGIINKSKKRNNQFLVNQNIDIDEFIKVFYNHLISNKLIDASLPTFKKQFNKDWENKVKWLGTEIQITKMISLLIENQFLDPETSNFKYVLIKSHFINKKGKIFKQKQLSSVYSDKNQMIPKDDVVFSIISKLSTHFM